MVLEEPVLSLYLFSPSPEKFALKKEAHISADFPNVDLEFYKYDFDTFIL